MRMVLFLLTNLSVMLIFGIIVNFIGLPPEHIKSLLIIIGLSGFSGSLISLFMSKWIALRSVNGKILKSPTTELEIWLFNVIHNLANQMGIKKPEISIYNSLNVNAFATGFSRNHSLIAVSSSLLDQMNRSEIEAVLAHEISHIANGDMITMTLLQGIVNTFVLFISQIMAQLVSILFHDTNSTTKNPPTISVVTSIICEMIFGILASMIVMWFSRYREFKADAGSAQLVGIEKIISALHRLKNNSEPPEPNHLVTFGINGRSKSIHELFCSHPSLDKRIKILTRGTYINK